MKVSKVAARVPHLWAGLIGPPSALLARKPQPIQQKFSDAGTAQATRPITVLHIAESFSSGVASAIHACVEAQPDNVVAMTYGYRIPGVQLAGEVDLPVAFHDLPAGKLNQLKAIRSIVAEQRPDVLHLHSSWAGFLTRILPFPRSTRVVFTPHCWGFQRRDISPLKRAAILTADRLVGRRTDVVLACSVREAELAREYDLARTVFHLQQQLPSDLKQRISELSRHRAVGSEPLTVGMSGRICPQKGVDFFAAVARGLRATPAGRQGLRLKWIGGGGSDAHLAELLAAGVEVTGWLDQDVAVKELADCDIYLHTAAWEGYPMTVLEAFELGLPVVARAIPALASEPRGASLVADPAGAIAELLSMVEAWPVVATRHQDASFKQRQQVLAAAYGA